MWSIRGCLLPFEVLAKVLYIHLFLLSLKNKRNPFGDSTFQMQRRSFHNNTKERIKPYVSLKWDPSTCEKFHDKCNFNHLLFYGEHSWNKAQMMWLEVPIEEG